VFRIARAAGVPGAEVVRRFTIRRGSVLRFNADGACAALQGTSCGVHRGRPLACRLYPLGLECDFAGGVERFVPLDPAPQSAGVYGVSGKVADFLESQGVPEYLAMNNRYRPLIGMFRNRVNELVDFEKVEPREFWRRATREALAESAYDANPIIDALFDPGDSVAGHVESLAKLAQETNAAESLAAAAVLLAVSLGYSPSLASEQPQ
jgi:Fe-S-cluster containining protein